MIGDFTKDAHCYVKSISYKNNLLDWVAFLSPMWRLVIWIQICTSLNHRKKMKAKP